MREQLVTLLNQAIEANDTGEIYRDRIREELILAADEWSYRNDKDTFMYMPIEDALDSFYETSRLVEHRIESINFFIQQTKK